MDKKLIVSLSRDERVLDYYTAVDGDQAASLALVLISDHSPLQAGDILTVRHFSDPALPEFSRASHASG